VPSSAPRPAGSRPARPAPGTTEARCPPGSEHRARLRAPRAARARLGQLPDDGDARLALGLQLGGHARRAVVVVRERRRQRGRLVPQAVVQEEAVHERAQQRRAHQVAQAHAVQLRARDKPGVRQV